MIPIAWHGCYDDNWTGLIVPAAFAHPAKMARGLVARIFDTLFAMGALERGSVVVDPFGGIGTTGIEGASRGVQVVCCELEPKFVALARENFAKHARDWTTMARPQPIIVQGDSRQLRQVLGLAGIDADALIASPPYTAQAIEKNSGSIDRRKQYETYRAAGGGASFEAFAATQEKHSQGYGESEGQLAALPAGSLNAVVSSPPYEGSDQNYAEGRTRIDWEKGARAGMKNDRISGPEAAYGTTDGQLGAMPRGSVDAVVASPPYEEIAAGAGGLNTKPGTEGQQGGRSPDSPSQDTDQRYGDTPGQLGKMASGAVEAVIASPPYATEQFNGRNGINIDKIEAHSRAVSPTSQARSKSTYGDAPANLANLPVGAVDAVVSSPPFTQGYAGGGGINLTGIGPGGADKVGSRTYQGTANERTEGNLERLTLGDVDAVVTSPPWGDGPDGAEGGVKGSKFRNPEDVLLAGRGKGASDEARLRQAARDEEKTYGDAPEQLANKEGETFWSAALEVVREAHAILKPGGHAVWVVKAFVRDKKIVDFPGDWKRLCEHVGFETVKEVHAMLIREDRRPDLFDGEVVTRKSRKSFFRRLYEAKYPGNEINWEVVWFMRKRDA